jgi:polar amino acid transport system substrate-binding protein
MRFTSTRALALVGAVAIVAGACTGSAATTAPSTASSAAPSVAASASAAPSVAPSVVASASAAAPASVAPSAAAVAAPDRIKAAGKLVWCSDISYAPEEFYAADGKTAQGSDIDIAAHIAQVWGVTNQVDNTSFDSIILSLKAKKCDLIISGMNDTTDRQKEVDFVDYLSVGQGLLVPTGNPKGIHTLADLSGKSVAVQKGTTNLDALNAENVTLKAAGSAPINIQVFTQDTNAFQQLALGRVDAYSTDSPVVAYYNSLPANAGKYDIGGQPIAPAAIGIAMRKDDAGMKDAVTAVINQMYADGSLAQIVAKWGMTNAVVMLK